VIVYSVDDKSQFFYSGSEETQGITAISVSFNKKYIAICERDELKGAQCSIFEVAIQRKKKTINWTDAKEFVAV
jgi:cilia- and flagella-associated protein 57